MADGTTKPIDRITVGESVLAADPATGRVEAKQVTATITGEGDKNLYEITVDPATTTQTPQVAHPADDTVKAAATYTVDVTESQTLTATDGHPFWLPQTREWLTADKLQPGQWLETSAGTWVQISSIRSHTAHQRVNNLTVSDLHTYYVLAGATPVLVHNTGPLECDLRAYADLARLGPGKNEGAASVLLTPSGNTYFDISTRRQGRPCRFSRCHCVE